MRKHFSVRWKALTVRVQTILSMAYDSERKARILVSLWGYCIKIYHRIIAFHEY